MFKTYTKEKINESAIILDSKARSWACKTVFWFVATIFSVVKLVNATSYYGMAIGGMGAARIIADDMIETEDT